MNGRVSLALSCAALLAACSRDDPATTTGTCDQIEAFQTCTEYEDLPAGLAPELADLCTQGLGTWSNGPCPAAGRTGVCSWVEMGVTIRDAYYAPASADLDAQYCVDGGGSWTPG